MLDVKVLGAGCANCKRLERDTRTVLDNLGFTYELTKVTDYADIAAYGVMQTPALVLNEKVVVSGRIPKRDEINVWVVDAMDSGES